MIDKTISFRCSTKLFEVRKNTDQVEVLAPILLFLFFLFAHVNYSNLCYERLSQ